jgi:hypothetical protein
MACHGLLVVGGITRAKHAVAVEDRVIKVEEVGEVDAEVAEVMEIMEREAEAASPMHSSSRLFCRLTHGSA